jgi:hypothetical protein
MRWWDFIGRRRQLVPDQAWYGAGLVIIGCGGLPQLGGWGRWLGAVVALCGMVLIGLALHRRLRSRP